MSHCRRPAGANGERKVGGCGRCWHGHASYRVMKYEFRGRRMDTGESQRPHCRLVDSPFWNVASSFRNVSESGVDGGERGGEEGDFNRILFSDNARLFYSR